ncbi:MAG: FmdE family protein [Desulfofustis sp.]|jgi:formylmethanofuran dehydrogenase subunit E|nr:FmdE family protein [Desulfofustis sp.]
MYIPAFITEAEDYRRCARFHGHTCMGLTIGYLAAKLALERLGVSRADDEELVVIVENDACCCDAIQVLTGCTFGKGNFVFRDIGKMAFTFAHRDSGKSLRLVFNNAILAVPEAERRLADLIRDGKASAEDMRTYESVSEKRIDDLFAAGPEVFFSVEEVSGPLPPKASIAPSMSCSQCGELVMQTKLVQDGERMLCLDCTAQ